MRDLNLRRERIVTFRITYLEVLNLLVCFVDVCIDEAVDDCGGKAYNGEAKRDRKKNKNYSLMFYSIFLTHLTSTSLKH
jgi:hypothetical protein